MIHLWYSASLPSVMVKELQQGIVPYIDEVSEKIKGEPTDILLRKSFSFGTTSLCVVLGKADWQKLKEYVVVPKGLTIDHANHLRRRVTEAPERIDFMDRARYLKPPGWRAGMTKFREDGILLPYGASRKEFDTPNPTFFQTSDVWPIRDDADPLSGWSHADFSKFAPRAKEDMYGGLFFLLRDLFLKFCTRLRNTKVVLYAFKVDARIMPAVLNQVGLREMLFDRIEVSNIGDRQYLGPSMTITTFAPLLKPKQINPHATLVMLFMNAAIRKANATMDEVLGAMNIAQKFTSERLFEATDKFSNITSDLSNPEVDRLMYVNDFFWDHDKAFNAFMEEERSYHCAERHGLRIKEKHSIVEKWPLRVTETSSKQWFEIVSATAHTSHERYVELERQESGDFKSSTIRKEDGEFEERIEKLQM